MIVMTPAGARPRSTPSRERLETTGVHVVVMPGELTTAIGAIGDPEGVRELGLEGMAGVDRVVPISRPYKLASSRAQPRRADASFEIGGRTRRRRRHVLPDRRAVHGRVARADARRSPARSQAARRRRCCAAARSSRAPRRSRSRASASRRWRSWPRRARRPACRSSPSCSTRRTPTSSPSTPTSCRSARATCRTTRCSRSPASSASRCCSSAGCRSSLDELLQAADYILKEGNEAVDPLRARDPHVRDRDALHARPRRDPVAEAAHAPAGDRRPQPRRRRPPAGRPLSRAARRPSAPTGIIVEVHQDPEAALCDGPQALYASHFAEFARDVAAHAGLLGKRLA